MRDRDRGHYLAAAFSSLMVSAALVYSADHPGAMKAQAEVLVNNRDCILPAEEKPLGRTVEIRRK